MKAAFFGLEKWEEEYVKENITARPEMEVLFFPQKLDKDHLPPRTDFEIISVFVGSSLDKETLEKFPALKFITTRSTGFDHIDLEYCRVRKIIVANVPSYGENTVAEYTFGLILSLSRKIYEGVDRIRETGKFSSEGLKGFDLRGKTLGVLGTGKIGCHVIRIAGGFEMKIIAFDPFPKNELVEKLGFEYKNTMEEVLTAADILTIHVPYMKETHHLLNERAFSLMKKEAYLINTSRGGVVETSALVKALLEKKLGGAGLDVLEEEGVIKDELDFLVFGHPEEHNLKTVLANHVLMDMPNVLITPHNAFNTAEALQRILDTTMENVESFLQGQPQNTVK